MMETIIPTECVCNCPGFCELMRRDMCEVRWEECKNKKHYFEMFLGEAQSGSYERVRVLREQNKVSQSYAGLRKGNGKVGTILKNILRRFALHVCIGCAILVDILDEQGPNWCRDNMEWILDEMKKNAGIAGVPFSRFVAKRFVNFAIRKAERNKKESGHSPD